MKTRQYRRKMQTAGSVSFMDRPVDNSFTYMGGNDKTPNLWGTSPQSLGISIPGNTLSNSMLIPNEYQKPIDEVQQANGPVYADLDDSKVKSNPYSVSNVLSGNTPPSQQKPTQQRNGTWGDVMYGANVLGSWLGANNANRQNRNYIQSNTANPLLNEAKNDGRSEGVQYGYNNFQNGGLKNNNNIKMNKQQEAQILSAYLQQVPPQNRQAIMKQLGQLKQQSPQKYAQTIMQLAQQMQQGQGQQGDEDQQQMQARYGAYMQKGGTADPEHSIVDLLASKGQDTSYAYRKGLANSYGIKNYTGSADQNQMLLHHVMQDDNQPVNAQVNPTNAMQQFSMSGKTYSPAAQQSAPTTQVKPTKSALEELMSTNSHFYNGNGTNNNQMKASGDYDYSKPGTISKWWNSPRANGVKFGLAGAAALTGLGPLLEGIGGASEIGAMGEIGTEAPGVTYTPFQPQPGYGISGARIFTPGGSYKKGGYLQQGGQPQQQDNQMQQVIQKVVQLLQSGQQPQQVVAMLVKMGIPHKQAIQLVQQVMQQLQQSQGQQGSQQQDPSQQAPQQAPQQGMQPQAMYGRRMQEGGYFTQNYFPSFYKTRTGWMQDGGQQPQEDPSQEGSPQDQQQDAQQGQQPQQGGGQDGQMQQIIQQIIQMLQSGQSPQQVVAALVKMGIPQQQAIQLVQQVMQQMQQQGGAQGGQQQQGGDSDEQQQPGMKMGGRYRKMGGRYC